MAELEALKEIVSGLDSIQIELLVEMANAMQQNVSQTINPQSDILTPAFLSNFRNRLCLYHVMHVESLSKKAFEYLFLESSKAAGRKAELVSGQTNPGKDIVVDAVDYSLKTEAAEGISDETITISKLMEARWIRDCRTQSDFARETKLRVGEHLNKYTRILMLRAFSQPNDAIRYNLVEIPVTLLEQISTLGPDNFGPRTKSGGSKADVIVGGDKCFCIRLDGSVEKITISSLKVSRCIIHGSWIVPINL